MQELLPEPIRDVALAILGALLAGGLTALVVAVLPLLVPIWSTPAEDRDDEAHLQVFSEAAAKHEGAGHAVAVCALVALPILVFVLGLAVLDADHASPPNVVIFYGGGLIAVCHGLAGVFLGSLIHGRWLAIRYGRAYAENIDRVWRITDERAGGLLGRAVQHVGWAVGVFLIPFSIALLGNRYTVVTAETTDLGRRGIPWTRVALPHEQVRRIVEKGAVGRAGLFRHRAYYVLYEDGTVLTSDADLGTNLGINDLSDTFHVGRAASAIALIARGAGVTPERWVEEVKGVTDVEPGLYPRQPAPEPPAPSSD